MKIAVPTRNGHIDDHFGHCDHYTLFSLDADRTVVETERLDAPQGCGCKSDIAATLANLGVGVMLAGNMGEDALRILSGKGIKVVRGCTGDVRNVVDDWLAGRITDQLIQCNHDDCSGH